LTTFLYVPAGPSERVARTHALQIVLERHPSNLEAAAIMGVAGYRSIRRRRDGRAEVHVERFGRDPQALQARLVDELRRLTTAKVTDPVA
jgi:hypothetical protein